MNEELQKELALWLASLRQGAESASNFVLEQAPLVVQEKIAYGRVVETTEFVATVVFALLLMWAGLHYRQSAHQIDPDVDTSFLPGIQVASLPTVTLFLTSRRPAAL